MIQSTNEYVIQNYGCGKFWSDETRTIFFKMAPIIPIFETILSKQEILINQTLEKHCKARSYGTPQMEHGGIL